jgi:hypothetical protein
MARTFRSRFGQARHLHGVSFHVDGGDVCEGIHGPVFVFVPARPCFRPSNIILFVAALLIDHE